MENPPKKLKRDVPSGSSSNFDEFMEEIRKERLSCSSSIEDFDFNKKRARVLSKADEFPESGKGVLYWMHRDIRIQDNWSLLYAQRLALKFKVPLHVCFWLFPCIMQATARHTSFVLKGLRELENEYKNLKIGFHLISGTNIDALSTFVTKNNFGAVVVDFCPLRNSLKWTNDLTEKLSKSISVVQVDAHNIVPCWVASEKKEYAARTIRRKINDKLDEFLTQFPPVVKHPYESEIISSLDWKKAEEILAVDRKVVAVDWAQGGCENAFKTLYDFIKKKLKDYNSLRNDPTKDVISGLSPWLHFGHISAQRCVLSVREMSGKYKNSVDAYCEETIIRRELADNFCFYNEKYDSIEGAEEWAIKSLIAHKNDKRTHLYNKEQLEQGKTHDDLWNAAQKQLLIDGKIHGFLRMYWAKKILEWTNDPEEALEIALYLNDKYSLDGTDPNGFVGCMWSICGIHDQGWKERSVFGKIRYMNYEGCKRKFDVPSFVMRYNKKFKEFSNKK